MLCLHISLPLPFTWYQIQGSQTRYHIQARFFRVGLQGAKVFSQLTMATNTSLKNTQITQFNGNNYDYWAITMKDLFFSQEIWDLVENGFPKLADAAEYNALTRAKKDLLRDNKNKDSKALFYIFQVVHESISSRIATTKSSKKSWDILQITYQGMTKVETTKLQILRRDFETMYMKDGESVDFLFTQIIGLVNQIRSHGETLEDRRVVEKILRSFPTKFELIVVSMIEETNNLSQFSIDELHASLISHEHRLSRSTNTSFEHAFK